MGYGVCKLCGGKVLQSNPFQICQKQADCRTAYNAAYQQANSQIIVERHRQNWVSVSDEKKMLMAARSRAGKRGIPFNLTVEDIVIPSNCPLCSCKLTKRGHLGRETGRSTVPSLDRYDPSLGYTRGNILVICFTCNRRKQDMTGEQMIDFGRALRAAFDAYPQREIH